MTDAIDPAALVLGYLAELRGVTLDDWTEGPVGERGLRLHRLRVLADLLATRISAVEQSLADSMETDRIDVPSLGQLVREEVVRERWKGDGAGERLRDDLAMAVAQDVAMDVGTGELDPIKRNVALATMRAAYDAIPSFSSLKVAGRRRFGLHIADYRDYSTGYKVTVISLEDE